MSTPSCRRVSVVVPTCDRPALLAQALASIRALEGADLAFEIIVGDNGRSPGTAEVAAAFGASRVLAARAGAARNAAARRATADVVAFLDDDDVWLPGHIRPHLAHLDRAPAVDMVLGQIINVDAGLAPTYGPWPADLPEDGAGVVRRMLGGYFPQIGGTVVRASVLRTTGLFDEMLLGDQDWDWHLRVARHHGVGEGGSGCSRPRLAAGSQV